MCVPKKCGKLFRARKIKNMRGLITARVFGRWQCPSLQRWKPQSCRKKGKSALLPTKD